MEIPELVIEKECKNRYHIYLFYVDENWWAFGYSAYYLSVLYPWLQAAKTLCPEHESPTPCLHVPDLYLSELSDLYNALVSDACIQFDAPATAYSYRSGFDEWCDNLICTFN